LLDSWVEFKLEKTLSAGFAEMRLFTELENRCRVWDSLGRVQGVLATIKIGRRGDSGVVVGEIVCIHFSGVVFGVYILYSKVFALYITTKRGSSN
jgi:hypothetical protein